VGDPRLKGIGEGQKRVGFLGGGGTHPKKKRVKNQEGLGKKKNPPEKFNTNQRGVGEMTWKGGESKLQGKKKKKEGFP